MGVEVCGEGYIGDMSGGGLEVEWDFIMRDENHGYEWAIHRGGR